MPVTSFCARRHAGRAAIAATVVAALASIVGPGPVRAAADTDAERVATGLRETAAAGRNIAWDWVSELTTRFGPRPAGSASEHAAAEWAAARLRTLGFDEVRIETFPVTAWVRGTETAQIVAPFPQPLVIAALGESPPTPPAGIEAEVVVFGSLEELQAAPPGSLTGRVAMVAAAMVRTEDGAGYSSAVGARIDGPRDAARRGAIAFLLRSTGTGTHRFAHTGTTRYVDGRVPIPSFALSAPDALQIQRLAALGDKVRVRLTSTARYIEGARSQNVIAEVRGSERPREIVLLGAHLDSWDQGTGAIDDAAGTAIVVAAARLIHELPQRPRRTVRIVLFGSEEVAQPAVPFGAFGGHAYARAHRAELPEHVLAGESDLGADRVYALALPPPWAKSGFAHSAARVLAPIGVLMSPGPPDDVGTDVQPSVDGGVPGMELNQDATRYFDIHHTPDDTLERIDRAQLDQNVAAWAALAWLAADSGQLPARTPAEPAPP
ncbi:MAG: M28 family peptidase [Proteobacteria bacterium]|nr:M28 family peptidase [Pseudomonadota bacterium]